MTKLTIQISVIHGKYLERILSSIGRVTTGEVEVIVVNSGGLNEVSQLCSYYGALEIKMNCSLLMSRYLGTVNATGDFVLILDETRVPSDGLVESVINSPHEMMAFPEIQVGKGLINWLDNLDKKITFEGQNSSAGIPLVIPRLYSTRLLMKAFNQIRTKLSPSIFSQIVAKDDRIIFSEASCIAEDNVFLSKFSILHYNDTNIFKEFRKYFRYGATSSYLIGTPYEGMLTMIDKFRKINRIAEVPVLFLHGFRGIAFSAGLYLERLRSCAKEVP